MSVENPKPPTGQDLPRSERAPYQNHPLYEGGISTADDFVIVHDEAETGNSVKVPIKFNVVKPTDPATGKPRDQTNDAAENMRYAASLGLPTLKKRKTPRRGRAIIIGGAPSVKNHLDEIRELAKDPLNEIFAINWTHTWLLEHGITPKHCVFFEIDPEPEDFLASRHPDIIYYVCCHCNRVTFDSLKGAKTVLWHTYPNSNIEKDVNEELFKDEELVGGGLTTFTRTLTIAMFLGFRHLDLFGCDSSFPDEGNTHVDGYQTLYDAEVDGMFVYARNLETGEMRRYRTTGTLLLQNEEFKEYCASNHSFFSMIVHGDSFLRFTHETICPEQYKTDESQWTK